jgi:hypothetical protein
LSLYKISYVTAIIQIYILTTQINFNRKVIITINWILSTQVICGYQTYIDLYFNINYQIFLFSELKYPT